MPGREVGCSKEIKFLCSLVRPQGNELIRGTTVQQFSTFVYRESSHPRRSAAWHKFYMVWPYRSAIPALIQNAMPYSASQTGWRKMNASLEGKKMLVWGPGCYIANTGFLRRRGNFRWRIHSSNRNLPQIKSMWTLRGSNLLSTDLTSATLPLHYGYLRD